MSNVTATFDIFSYVDFGVICEYIHKMKPISLFEKSCRRMLLPVVKVLLRNGVAYRSFMVWVKQVFVDAAADILIEDKGKATTSAISVMTGLHRKDVAYFKEEQDTSSYGMSQDANRAIKVVTAWSREPDFLDNNNPMSLPVQGGAISFEALCDRFSGNVTYRSVLDELRRLNLVEIFKVQRVEYIRLLKQEYIPDAGIKETFNMLGFAGADLFTTIAHNMSIDHKNDESHLQLSVAYEDLSPQTVAEFKQLSETKSMILLRELDSWLAKQHAQQSPAISDATEDEDIDQLAEQKSEEKEKLERAGLGIYFFKNKNQLEN